MDSAFFSDESLTALEAWGIEFTVSVPFERFAELKDMIEARRRWRRVNGEVSYFETSWKAKRWDQRYRFIVTVQALRACGSSDGAGVWK